MKKLRVLISDDHELVRQGIRIALSSFEDIEVVAEAYDGNTLFGQLKQYNPDCLLIDISMPNFKPIQDIQRIHEIYPDLKILVISAYDDDIYVKGLFLAGIHGYHLKSQPMHDIKKAIDRIVANKEWIASPLIKKINEYHDTNFFHPNLSVRQLELLHLLQEGFDNKSISQYLNLSIKTVENNLTDLYKNLGVQSRLEAVKYLKKHPEILSISPISNNNVIRFHNADIHQKKKILLVDDNSHYRNELGISIKNICKESLVYEAENTAQALELSQKYSPDLIFIDMILGKENGSDCTKEIIKVHPHARIILISAYPDREFHRLGLDAGAIAFLDKKDLDLSSLRQILSDI